MSFFADETTQPISPRYCTINLSINAITGIVASLLVALICHQPWLDISDDFTRLEFVFYAVIWFFTCWLMIYHWFADPRIRFAARTQDVVLHKGWFFWSVTCQPIKRVQHVELKQGPVARYFKLANLNIYSAGGASHTFSIPGLPEQQAQELRDFIMRHKDIHHDQ